MLTNIIGVGIIAHLLLGLFFIAKALLDIGITVHIEQAEKRVYLYIISSILVVLFGLSIMVILNP